MAFLDKIADALLGRRGAGPVINVFGIAAGVALVAMMLLTTTDVTLRYVFNSPVYGSFQLTMMMMVVYVAGGFAVCASLRGHVKVDLILSRLPPRVQAILNTITGIPCVFLFALMSWSSFKEMVDQFGFGQTFEVIFAPIYPFLGIVGLGFALLTLVLLANILRSLSRAVRKSDD